MTIVFPFTDSPQSMVDGGVSKPYVNRFPNHVDDLEHGMVPVADGVRIHYVVAGEGDPVLLIPGWPQSWFAWRFCIPLLANAGRKVYAIDPRGFGDSDIPSSGYDLGTAAEDVHTFISTLGLADEGRLDIVSHDVGSWIAYAHAVAYPQDLRRLVITDATIPGVSPNPPGDYPTGLKNERSWHFGFNRLPGLPELLIQGREREFLSWFFGPAKLTRTWTIDTEAFEEYLRVFSRPGAITAGLNYYRHIFSAEGRADNAERCKSRLDMPILTIGGSDADSDGLYRTMSQFSDNVRNLVFEGIGHHLPEECPEDMVDAILAFWDVAT